MTKKELIQKLEKYCDNDNIVIILETKKELLLGDKALTIFKNITGEIVIQAMVNEEM